MDYEKCGQFLALLRKEKNITQKELANILNYSFQTISKWERGESFPTDLNTLKRMSKVFNVSIEEIRNGERYNSVHKKEIFIINKIKELYNKHKKIIIFSLVIFLIIIILLLLGVYYFFIRGHIRVYDLSIRSTEFRTDNSVLIIDDNKKSILLFNEIESINNKKVQSFKIYYEKDNKDNVIIDSNNENIKIEENNSYNEYNLKILDQYPMFIDISYDGVTETFMIDLSLSIENTKILNKNESNISDEKIISSSLEKFNEYLLKNNFKKEGNNYILEKDNMMVSYAANSMLLIQLEKENQRIEANSFIDGNMNEVSVSIVDNSTQEIVTDNYNTVDVKNCFVEKCDNVFDLVSFVNYLNKIYADFYEL